MSAVTSTTELRLQSPRPDPEPPRDGEDRTEWRAVYRGRGVPRQVGAVVEVELTPAQKAWLDALAAEYSLTLAETVSTALDLARTRQA